MKSSSAGTAATAFWTVSSEQATRSCTLYLPRAPPCSSAAKARAAPAYPPARRRPRASPDAAGGAVVRGVVVGVGGGVVGRGLATVTGGRAVGPGAVDDGLPSTGGTAT